VPLAARKYKDHGPALAISAEVELGRKSAAGTAERLCLLAAFCAGRVLVGADDGAVYVVRGPVDPAYGIGAMRCNAPRMRCHSLLSVQR
jgi:hypothetical protein